jgi:hypothetical protein
MLCRKKGLVVRTAEWGCKATLPCDQRPNGILDAGGSDDEPETDVEDVDDPDRLWIERELCDVGYWQAGLTP